VAADGPVVDPAVTADVGEFATLVAQLAQRVAACA